jgi:hypothetical protein
MAAFADTDGGCEKYDPDLAIPGQFFCPRGGVVKNIPGYNLIKHNGYEDRKQKNDNDFSRFPEDLHQQ